jgi:hypothetical protein
MLPIKPVSYPSGIQDREQDSQPENPSRALGNRVADHCRHPRHLAGLTFTFRLFKGVKDD